MRKYFFFPAIVALCFGFVSCVDDTDVDHGGYTTMSIQNKSVATADSTGVEYFGSWGEVEETTQLVYVYRVDYNPYKRDTVLVETQPLYRGIAKRDLGTHEVAEYGNWSAANGEITKGDVTKSAGYGNFTVETRVDVYGATISNGALNLNTNYELTSQGAIWTNEDTTIVFAIQDWAVEEIATVCDGEGNLSNTIKTTYAEYVQNASERGQLIINNKREVEEGRTFVGAAFSCVATGNEWNYSAAVRFNDGTFALPISMTGTPAWQNGTWWEGISDEALNGAYFAKNKYYPVIASDQNGLMEWSLCAQQGSTCLKMLSYADADGYNNWNNNDKVNGQHTVHTDRFSVKDNSAAKELTFFYNGVNVGTFSYAEL